MGEAKRRGTFEERRRLALERDHRLASEAARRASLRKPTTGAPSAAIAALSAMAMQPVMPRQIGAPAPRFRRGAQRGR